MFNLWISPLILFSLVTALQITTPAFGRQDEASISLSRSKSGNITHAESGQQDIYLETSGEFSRGSTSKVVYPKPQEQTTPPQGTETWSESTFTRWWFPLIMLAMGLLPVYLTYRILAQDKDFLLAIKQRMFRNERNREHFLFFKNHGRTVKIPTREIKYIQSAGNYLEVHTEDHVHLIRARIKEYRTLLPDPNAFMRIHRSYVVRLDQIEERSPSEVVIKGSKIPVSKTYRRDFIRKSNYPNSSRL
ncbi:LytTR family transcriptional regulator [bacterium SCSIO 12741]|nr:LytTR family transcriptional regulator [bacterium SCSIO 12741]